MATAKRSLDSWSAVLHSAYEEQDAAAFYDGALIAAWVLGASGTIFSTRYVIVDLHYEKYFSLLSWQFLFVFVSARLVSLYSEGRKSSSHPDIDKTSSLPIYQTVAIGTCLGGASIAGYLASITISTQSLGLLTCLVPLALLFKSYTFAITRDHRRHSILCCVIVLLLTTCFSLQFQQIQSFGHLARQLSTKMMWSQTTYMSLNDSAYFNSTDILEFNRVSSAEMTSRFLNVTASDAVREFQDRLQHTTWLVTALGALGALAAISLECHAYELLHRSLSLLSTATSCIEHTQNVPLVLMGWHIFGAIVFNQIDVSGLIRLPLGVLLINGLASSVFLSTTLAILAKISTLSYTMSIVFLRIFLVFLACVLYQIPVNAVSGLLYLMAFSGFCHYIRSDGSIENSSADETRSTADNSCKSSHTRFDPGLVALFTTFLLAIMMLASYSTPAPGTPSRAVSTGFGRSANTTAYQDKKVATIIEPRNLPHLGPLLLSMASTLPDDWPVVAWVGPENIEVLRTSPAIVRAVASGRLTLRLFPHQYDVHNQEYLSRFLTKPWFWELLDAEWILFFQSDSILCSRSPQKLDDWIGYDWVGAPWMDDPNAHGGNGGLSIRKRSSLLKLTRNPDIARDDWGDPEDVWFSQQLHALPGVQWPTEHQGKFSVENLMGEMHEWAWKPLGVHMGGQPPGTWRTPDIMVRLGDWCPELKLFWDPVKYLPPKPS